MRWFFLVLLIVVAFGIEALIFGGQARQLSVDRLAIAVAFGVFCSALLLYWLTGYFLKGTAQERGWEVANSFLLLSIGGYCVLVGREILVSANCTYSLPEGGTSFSWERDLARITDYLQGRGWCDGFAYSFFLLGCLLSSPTLKILFGRLKGRAGGPPA